MKPFLYWSISQWSMVKAIATNKGTRYDTKRKR